MKNLNCYNMNFENQEQEKSFLSIDDPDIISKLAEIEGDHWKDDQEFERELEGEKTKNYSVLAAQQFVERARAKILSLRQELEIEGNPEEIKDIEEEIEDLKQGRGPKAEIYGSGGVNRYFVLSNGKIVISESHIMSLRKNEILEKARELGIDAI